MVDFKIPHLRIQCFGVRAKDEIESKRGEKKFFWMWIPICSFMDTNLPHTNTLSTTYSRHSEKNVQFNQNFLHYLVKLHTQMHLYIEPLNGSIDVTSFFRRMQYTTQKIAFLF